MVAGPIKNLNQLEEAICNCKKCPRLVKWTKDVAKEKRKSYENETYWGKPVPGFGDKKPKLLVVGLAPGAHGANRTGRIFTGDRSGEEAIGTTVVGDADEVAILPPVSGGCASLSAIEIETK